MSWSLFDGSHLRHTNGSLITLVSGTWQEPLEINPQIPDSITAVDQAHLIRQGLIFARQRAPERIEEYE